MDYLNYYLKRNSGKIRSRYYKQYWVIVFFFIYILMEREIERKKDREEKNRRQ